MRSSFSNNHDSDEDEEILDVTSARIQSARSSYASQTLGRDEEDLLRRADGVNVSKEDKQVRPFPFSSLLSSGRADQSCNSGEQNGYDTSLLALQPRSTSSSRPTSSSAASPDASRPTSYSAWSTSGSTYASGGIDVVDGYLDSCAGEDETSPFASTFDDDDASPGASISTSAARPARTRRPSVAESIPSIGTNLNPRFAANAYAQRAQNSESQAKLARYRSSVDEEAAIGEKGYRLDGGTAGKEEKKPWWKRRNLLILLGVVLLVVCISIGVGAGVAVSNSGKNASAASSATFSPSSTSSAPTASVIPSSASNPAATATGTTTDWGTVGVTGTQSYDSGQYTQAAGARRRR
jgi:hypothetical protein